MPTVEIQRLQDISPSPILERAFDVVADGSQVLSRYVFKSREKDATFQLSPRFATEEVAVQRGTKPAPLPSVEVAILRDAKVFLKQGILTGDGKAFFDWMYLHPHHFAPAASEDQTNQQRVLWGMTAKDDGKAELVHDVQDGNVVVEEPALFLGSPGDAAYSHFVWDTLPMLWFLKVVRPWCRKVVIEKGMPGYKRELLTAAGLTSDDIIERDVNETVLFRTLIVPGRISVNNFLIRDEGLDILRSLSAMHDGSPRPKGAERIFVDRGGDRASIRRITNEDQLWSILQPLGFIRVSPGLMSLSEKKSTFGAAKYVVGQYGGGMQNHFLCGPRTKMFLLQSSSFSRDIHEFTADKLQHDVVSVFGKAKTSSNNSDFTINPELFVKVLAGRFLD